MNENTKERMGEEISLIFERFELFLALDMDAPAGREWLYSDDDIKHYLVHDILNILSYIFVYSNDEEKCGILERCNIAFKMCKFYYKFDIDSAIEYNGYVNRVTEKNFDKKCNVLVNELKMINAFYEWKLIESNIAYQYAYEMLIGLLYWIVIGECEPKAIQYSTLKDKMLYIIFDKLFRRYSLDMSRSFGAEGTYLKGMIYSESSYFFPSAVFPLIIEKPEDITQISSYVFGYCDEEFDSCEECEQVLYDVGVIKELPCKSREEELDLFFGNLLVEDKPDDNYEEKVEIPITNVNKKYIKASEVPEYENYDTFDDQELFIDKMKRKLF